MTVVLDSRYHQNGSPQKTLGAVYTPPRVASALARWAVRGVSNRVLDPACGEGVFLAAARTRLADLGDRQPTCLGVDIDPLAASASGAICRDFFEWVQLTPMFDAIVGNPPFIRSHLFPEGSRTIAFQQMREMGLHPSRLMSTWAPFIALTCKILSRKGRLAFVVPEELLQVGYAEELRHFLLSRFRRVIVCFPTPDLFPSVQQAVVLLLCDNELSGPQGLLTIPFAHLEDGPPYPVSPAPPWEWCSKWTHLFLSPKDRETFSDSFRQLGFKPLREYGRVEVGVVTGDNGYFILTETEAKQVGDEFVTPIICGARDLKGIRLSNDDFRLLVKRERPTYLLHTSTPVDELPPKLQERLQQGVEQGVNRRYKCRNREPWYAVPSVWPADALLLRQAGEVPKIVHLDKKYASTDTIHRIRWKQPVLSKRHAVGFLNTWTLLACEIMGRSYGGGVLELMPSEANNIPLPPPLSNLDTVFDNVDEKMRLRRFDSAIELVDAVVMPPRVTHAQENDCRNILSKLIRRRKTRENGDG
ncbi:MAG: N-6 DNA methylase [Chloroflexi bacterium]|nr:N-6 DNA methylase [Chloroflexota bacterium]